MGAIFGRRPLAIQLYMITRTYLRPYTAIRYSWKNILFSATCASGAWLFVEHPIGYRVEVPLPLVAILGTALAIILGFRNASAYDRWWEARKIWGGVVNESRTLTRQLLTLSDPRTVPPGLREAMHTLVRTQLAWINALRLQLRGITDDEAWTRSVARHLHPATHALIMQGSNRVTQLSMTQGRGLRSLHSDGIMDSILFAQVSDTLGRLTDLQGMAERIRSTPLPRPYDYYTMAFLNLFILFLPFGTISHFAAQGLAWLVLPVTVVVGWTFFQIYIFGKVLSVPFANWHTDVALDAICTTIEIDLKETIGDADVPAPLVPENGVLM
jgi:putative membrane protein